MLNTKLWLSRLSFWAALATLFPFLLPLLCLSLIPLFAFLIPLACCTALPLILLRRLFPSLQKQAKLSWIISSSRPLEPEVAAIAYLEARNSDSPAAAAAVSGEKTSNGASSMFATTVVAPVQAIYSVTEGKDFSDDDPAEEPEKVIVEVVSHQKEPLDEHENAGLQDSPVSEIIEGQFQPLEKSIEEETKQEAMDYEPKNEQESPVSFPETELSITKNETEPNAIAFVAEESLVIPTEIKDLDESQTSLPVSDIEDSEIVSPSTPVDEKFRESTEEVAPYNVDTSGTTFEDDSSLSDYESATTQEYFEDPQVMDDEKVKLQSDLDAVKKIIGCPADSQLSLMDQIEAVYVFMGMKPPLSIQEVDDLEKARKELELLKLVIGVK